MATWAAISLALIALTGGCSAAAEEEYFASFTRLEQCSGMDNLLVKVHKIYLNYLGDNQYALTMNLSTDQDLNKPLDMRFEVVKCASEQGPCEDFVNHTIENLCDEMEIEGSITQNLFKVANLVPKCPIKKGVYVTNKAVMNIDAELLEVGKYVNYWKFKVFLMKGPKKPILCLYIEGKVSKITKVKKRRKGRH